MLRTIKFRSKQAGLSLIEALLVLGLLATIITVITQNFQKASEQQKIQTMNQEVFQIYTSVQDNFADEGTTGLTNEIATQLGIKPATVKGVDATWRHALEGEYEVSAGSGGIYDFELKVTHVPEGFACSELIRGSKKASWTHILMGTDEQLASYYTPVKIAESCGTAGDKEITFGYYPDK